MATKKKALETVEEVIVTPESVAPEAPAVVEVDVITPIIEDAPVTGVFSLDKEAVRGVAIVRQSVLEDGRVSVFTADGVGYTFTKEEYNNL